MVLYRLRNVAMLIPSFVLVLIGAELALLMTRPAWAGPDETTPTGGQLPGTNGFTSPAQFTKDQTQFEEPETAADGVGPVFNATSCVECHHQPLTGGSSVTTELRSNAGLIHQRALNGVPIERLPSSDTPVSRRLSPSLFGLGFVECIGSDDLRAVVAAQPARMRGVITDVAVLEAPGQTRAGRFGVKCQHASLLSFSADAQLNEKGIGNKLLPQNGANEDAEDDIEKYARFMRSLNVPTPDRVQLQSAEAEAGARIFRQLGCATCHHESYVTLPAGASINGGAFKVPAALAGKTIFAWSDFALHDVGSGDGVGAEGFRTAPLWGARFRNRFFHDGGSATFDGAIKRHRGQATEVIDRYRALGGDQQLLVIQFLRAL